MLGQAMQGLLLELSYAKVLATTNDPCSKMTGRPAVFGRHRQVGNDST
jgi:hypothetical protein